MLKDFIRERAVFVVLAAAALVAAMTAALPARRDFVITLPAAPVNSGAAEAAGVPLAQAYGP